jgi:hypothetical protein
MKQRFLAALLVTALVPAVQAAAGDSAHTRYERALAHERTARNADNSTSRRDMRRIVLEYEAIVRRYPTSGYSDNALWQAANLSKLAFDRFGVDSDLAAARTLYKMLASEYPSSSLVSGAQAALRDLDAPQPANAPHPADAPPPADRVRRRRPPAPRRRPLPRSRPTTIHQRCQRATLRRLTRWPPCRRSTARCCPTACA